MARKRHRVAHIMPWEGVGGTEQAALRIARTVEDAGFDTTFFCLRSAPVVSEFFSRAGYDTVAWRDGYPSFNGYRYFLHESLQLAREFRRRAITLVHCADVPAGSYAALAGRLAMVPVNEVTTEGQPTLWIRDLPPVSSEGAPTINQGRIYFGEADSHCRCDAGKAGGPIKAQSWSTSTLPGTPSCDGSTLEFRIIDLIAQHDESADE